MKKLSLDRLRRFATRSLCSVGPLAGWFTPSLTASPDAPAQLLARHGSVPLRAAGAFVELGTFRIQVSSKLGRPDLALPDGTWLYHERRIGDSNAVGTLMIRFQDGRVNSLALVTPAVVAGLRASQKGDASGRIAAK